MASVDNPFEVFFDLVPTGAVLYAPVLDAGDDVVDFRFVRLNPAAQRLLGLPAQPTATFREQYPHSVPTGIFAQYRTAYLTGRAATYDVPYQGDGLDTCFRLVAQRSGDLLVVNFTDLADLPRSAAEQSLRESRAREQAARAEAEAQRGELQRVFEQAPVAIGILRGPNLNLELVNPAQARLWGCSPAQVLGQDLFDALPEVRRQGVEEIMAHVLQTGAPCYVEEFPLTQPAREPAGLPAQGYFKATYQPLYNEQGQITGLIGVTVEVTEQVLARRQLEQLNQELEARVQERTQQLEAAQAEAERQRWRLERFFMQAPAAICVHDGPQLVFELVNSAYQQLFAGRQLLGKPLLEALPEVANLPAYRTTLQVYQTGQTYQARGVFTPLLREDGTLEERYFDLIQQARYDEQGRIDGVLVFAFEVTEQVMARRQAEALQAQVLAAAQHQAAEREMFYQVFEQTPAAVCIQRGPTHRFEYVNPTYQALFADRVFPGRTPAEALPEVAEQGFVALLDRVYHTGETFRGTELPVVLNNAAGEPGRTIYFNFTYQAYRENGAIVGISTFAYDVTEQVLAKQQREQQQLQLHELFEQAPVAIAVFRGPQYVIELANPAVCALWDRTPAQAVGTPLFALLPESAGQGFEQLLDQVMATGVPFVAHELPSTVRRHGRLDTIYWNFVYQPLREADGQITGVTVVATEVTEQVLARRKVEESAQQVRAVVEGAPFLIGVYVGPEFGIELANQAMLEAMGKGPAVIGRRYAEVLPELENQAVFEQLQQVFTSGQPLHLRHQELEVVMDGVPQTFYYNYSFTPLRDTQGQVYGILNTAADVTDLVVARRRADEAAAELRQLAAHAPAFLFRTDPAGRITYLNDALFEWSGLDRAALASLDEAWRIGHPEDVAALHASFGAALAAGRSWESAPYRIRRRDGQYRWSITRTQPYFGPDGTVAGHSGVNLEIHEQVELQRQLQRTNADLDNFIYTASHDLKAPIANIEGLLLALEHELPAEGRTGDVPEMLRLMHDAVERFTRTIAHLTDISRLQKEHGQASEQVRLAAVIEEVQLDLTPLIHETQARLDVALPPGLTLTFSEKNLRSVVYNLLSNALKYRHPERRPAVRIRCRPQDGYQVLEVQDNGLGLDLAQGQERLFAMFQRLHTHVEGTGIGLYMVKKMVENAGGRIEVESQLGQGSAFRVYFLAGRSSREA